MYLIRIYHYVRPGSTLWEYIDSMLLLGVALEHGQGESVRLSVRPMRARMAPPQQIAGPDGLPQVQKPVLEHASPRGEGRTESVEFSSWSASHKRTRFGGVPDGGCGWGVSFSPPATTVAATWRDYTPTGKRGEKKKTPKLFLRNYFVNAPSQRLKRFAQGVCSAASVVRNIKADGVLENLDKVVYRDYSVSAVASFISHHAMAFGFFVQLPSFMCNRAFVCKAARGISS